MNNKTEADEKGLRIYRGILNKAESSTLVAFPESDDTRIIDGVLHTLNQGLATPLLLSNNNNHRALLKLIKDKGKNVAILSANAELQRIKSPLKANYCLMNLEENAEPLMNLAAAEDLTEEVALDKPISVAALLLRCGIVDGVIAGASVPSGEVISAGLQIVDLAESVRIPSSCFLMLTKTRALTFADCALTPKPSARQLADIAFAAAATHRKLTNEEPRVALLSFSTKANEPHRNLKPVTDALAIIEAREPDFEVDGELQLDAALVPEVAKLKAPGSQVAGQANVLVFPDLNSANIGYKIYQHLGGAIAVGPILMGFKNSLLDLSRGCDAEDISLIAATISLLNENEDDEDEESTV